MKILNVIDTREYEEDDDGKWKAIPGSGIMQPCDRCGKIHEIHVYVETEKGEMVVGLGCAKQESMVTESQHKSTGSCAKTIAKLEAMVKKEEERIRQYNEALAVATRRYWQERPVITKHESIFTEGSRARLTNRYEYHIEGSKRFQVSDTYEYAEQQLRKHWIEERACEMLSIKRIDDWLTEQQNGMYTVSVHLLEKLQDRLSRAQAKMEKLTVN